MPHKIDSETVIMLCKVRFVLVSPFHSCTTSKRLNSIKRHLYDDIVGKKKNITDHHIDVDAERYSEA